MKTFFILLFFLLPFVGYAQTEGEVWNGLEIVVGHNLRKDIGLSSVNSGNYISFRGRVGYYVTPNLSFGSSIAISEQGNKRIGMYPLCFEARYHPFKNKRWIVNGSIGYPLSVNQSNITVLFLNDFSFGCIAGKFWNSKVATSIGYNGCYFRDRSNDNKSESRHTFYLKVEVIF